jgi:hypothetical protein
MANAPQLTVGLGFDLDEASAKKVVKGMEQLGAYLEKSANDSAKKVENNWSSTLVNMAKGWIAFEVSTRGFQFTKDLFLLEEKFRSMQLPLKNLTEGTGDFGRSLSFITELADRTGQDLFVLGDGYKGIYASAKQAGIATEEVNKIFSSVVRAGSSLKLSNDQVSLSLKAIEQMMNKGTISSEELKQQLGDHLSGAYALMAKAAQDAGKVGSALVLPFFAKRMEEAFGKNAEANINTISGSANRLNNELTHLIDALDSGRVISFWASIQNGIADTFKDLTYLVNSGSWSEFMGYVTGSSILTKGKRIGQEILTRDFSAKPFKDQVLEFKKLQADFNKAKATSQGLIGAGITPDTSYLTQTAETLKKYAEIIKSAQKTGGTVKPPMSPKEGKEAIKVLDEFSIKLDELSTKHSQESIERLRLEVDRLKNSLKLFGATPLPNIFEAREQQSNLGEQLRKSFDITPLGDELGKSTENLAQRFEVLKQRITSGIKSTGEKAKEEFDIMGEMWRNAVMIIGDSVGNAFSGMFESIFDQDVKFDFKKVLASFLKAMGQMVATMGSAILAAGIGLSGSVFGMGEGAKSIAAGVGLIALGGALMGGGSAIGNRSNASPSENSSYQTQFKGAIGSQGGFDGGKVVFEIQGTTLKGVLNNTDKLHG